jgi:uncharacterized protein YndB with AHSA1/START domain
MRNQELHIDPRRDMPADRIEREIDIDAPIDVVWTVITEPEHITEWFTDDAELDLRPHGEGRFVWNEKATAREHVANVRVERLEPPRFFSFRWDYPDGAMPDETNAPLVEISLEPHGDSTRLRLVESGLEALALSDEAKDAYFTDHSGGWSHFVERLRDYAVTQRSAVAG